MNLMESLPESAVGVVAKNSIEYIESVFSLFRLNKIVIPLRSMDDEERISITKIKRIENTNIKTGWFSPKYDPIESKDPALISFTSGTTGNPKGVVIGHNALNDTVTRLIEESHITSDVKEYIGVPVYHSFGFGRCRLIATLKGKGFLPENGFNPNEISRMLKDNEINSIAAVPSQLRVLLHYKDIFENTDALRWIEIGSQPMSFQEKKELRSLFPKATIIQHYGLTEASRTSLLRIDNISDSFLDTVGRAVGNTEIRINGKGHICIKGPHMASSLIVDGVVTEIASKDGWFETSDMGKIDQGYLKFLGRSDNQINIAGQKISAEKIEDELRKEFSIVSGIAVTKINNREYGEIVLIAKDDNCSIDTAILSQKTEEILSNHGIGAKGVVKLIQCDKIPVTHTGKIKRNEIKRQYEDKKTIVNDSLHLIDVAEIEKKIKQDDEIIHCFSIEEYLYIVSSMGIDDIVIIQIEHDYGIISNRVRVVIKTDLNDNLDNSDYEQIDKEYRDESNSYSIERTGNLENDIIHLYKKNIRVTTVDPNKSFYEIGGDSLSYVSVSMELEKLLGFLPNSWDKISIKELSLLKITPNNNKFFSQIETSIFLRALAILAILCQHFGNPYFHGGGAVLLIIAGINFNRFQFSKFFNHGVSKVIKSILVNIALPYWLILIFHFAKSKKMPDLSHMLFYSNYIERGWSNVPFYPWFVQVLFTGIFVIVLPLSIKAIRRWVVKNRLTYIMLFLGAAIILRIGDEIIYGYRQQLLGQQTSWNLWLFLLGIAISELLVNDKKVIAYILSTVIVVAFYFNTSFSDLYVLPLILLLIVWIPRIKIPTMISTTVEIVSSSSLFIYLVHGYTPVLRFSNNWFIDIPRIMLGVLFGVITWWVYQHFLSVISKVHGKMGFKKITKVRIG